MMFLNIKEAQYIYCLFHSLLALTLEVVPGGFAFGKPLWWSCSLFFIDPPPPFYFALTARMLILPVWGFLFVYCLSLCSKASENPFTFSISNYELMWLIHHSYSWWGHVVKNSFHNLHIYYYCIFIIYRILPSHSDFLFCTLTTYCVSHSFRTCWNQQELFKPILKEVCRDLLLVQLFYSSLILYCWLSLFIVCESLLFLFSCLI